MRRWTAFVLPAILMFAGGVFLARVQSGGTLYADPQCNCAFLSGWNAGFIPCLRQGGVVTETCSAGVRNQPCVLTGTASWTPDIPTTCALNSSQSGVIGPVGTSNNALFFFNASQPQTRMFAYASAPCASTTQGFGGGWTSFTTCSRRIRASAAARSAAG